MKLRHLLRGAWAVAAGISLAAVVQTAPASADTAPPMGTITAGEGLIGGPSTQMLEIGLANSPQMLLTVNGGSTGSGALINVYQQTSAPNGLVSSNQMWQFIPDNGTDDVFQGSWGELKAVNSGLCLNVAGGGTAEFQQLIQWPCTNSSNEEWRTVQTGPKTFGLESELGGVYAGENAEYCDASNNTAVLTRDSSANPCTDWTIQRVGGQPVTLPDTATPSMVIDSNNPSGNWLTPAVTEQASPASATQAWYLQRVGTRTVHDMATGGAIDFGEADAPVYKIVSVLGNDWADATCLEAPGSQPPAGAAVETYGCDANAVDQPNQLWILDEQSEYGATQVADNSLASYESGAFVMFNDAMLGASQTTNTYPVLSVSSSIGAFDGSRLNMLPQNSTLEPARTQLWRLSVIPPANSGGGGSGGGTGCVLFACLLGG